MQMRVTLILSRKEMWNIHSHSFIIIHKFVNLHQMIENQSNYSNNLRWP
uniref:Uncharacterized protein n=1 Tax=Ascaris lumbricoides TaxID=6252 RepID=A0A0M3HJU0_ASCLU